MKRTKTKYGLRTLADLKTYEQVDITQVLHSGGFDSIVMNDLNGAGKAAAAGPKVLPLVVDWIVKSDTPVLVYSFKQRQGCAIDPKERLRESIKMAGHGVLLSKRCEVSGKDWISFATHGNETATNEYKHAGLVILWGVLHDSEGTMAARKLAAVAEEGADLSRSTLLEEHSGEKHHRILQALSRGAMRNPDQNNPSKASRMRALVIDGDKALVKEFARLLPGVKFTRRPGLGKKSGVMELGAGILEATLLNRHGPWPTSEAKRYVEKRLGEKLESRTWKDLRDAACEAAEWTTVGSGKGARLVLLEGV